MNPIVNPQQALALINRPDVLAMLAAQLKTEEAAQAASSPESEPGSVLDADAEDEYNELLDWGLDWEPLPNLKVKEPVPEPIEISSKCSGTSSEPDEDHEVISSDSAADIATDPEDEVAETAPEDEAAETAPEDEEAEETDPEICSILAESSIEDESDTELLPPSEDVWYDSLEKLQAAIEKHAVRQGYSITVKRNFTEKEKKNFQCDRSYRGRVSIAKNPYRNGHTLRGQNCQFRCRSARRNGRFRVVVTEPSHNHGRIDVRAMPKARKAFITPEIREYISEQSAAGTLPQEIINRLLIHHPSQPIKEKDVYNVKADIRKENLHGLSPLHALFAELENERDGLWAYDAGWDEDKKLLHLFLAHRDSLQLLICYYDVLIIDATYKTNMFGMPIVLIIGFDMFQKSFFAFFAFIHNEEEASYRWILQRVKRVYDEAGLEYPRTLITDRDSALGAAIEKEFPKAVHLLCRWHHNQNVKTNCRKYFSLEDDKEWKEFIACWAHCLDAVTHRQFSDRWADMKREYRSHPKPIKYLQKNWCPKKWLLKIAAFGTNRTVHYFTTTTSRAEGAHSIVKRALRVSTGDLKTVVEKLELIIKRQKAIRLTRVAEGRYGYGRFCESNQLFEEIIGVISPWALKKVAQQLPYIAPDMPSCTKVFKRISGLPCKHVLNQHIINNNEPLHADDFFKKWWFVDTRVEGGREPKRAICRIKNPYVIKTTKRSRRANAPKSSTIRGTTAAEDEDARLNRVRRELRRQREQEQQRRHSTTPGSTIVVATAPAPAETSWAAETRTEAPALPTHQKRGRPPKITIAHQAATSSATAAMAAVNSGADAAAGTESEDMSEVRQGKRAKVPSKKVKDRKEVQRLLVQRRERLAHK